MNDELKLKSCPFCGKPPSFIKADRHCGTVIWCASENCRCSPSMGFKTDAEAIGAWNSRPPVEAQAKGEATGPELNLSNWLSGSGCSVGPEPAPQPTPPTAETREAREAAIEKAFRAANDFSVDSISVLRRNVSDALRPVYRGEFLQGRVGTAAHPEPQAPRVSEGATKAIRQGLGMLASAVKCGEQWSHEHQRMMDAALDGLAALSQPAQGERKTERDMTDKEAREWKAWASVELNRRGEYFEPVVYGISYGSETVALNKFRKALKTRAEFGSAKEFDAAKRAKGREEG